MSSEPSPLPFGSVLADRFELHRVLGRGGYGIVYLARDLVREDRVVVKELAPHGVHRADNGVLDLDADPERSGHLLRQRFQHEAQLLRKVRSSGVPNLRTTFTENGTSYAVTDYVEGAETLAKVLQREGRLSEEAVREILVSMLDILERVHAANILHRDIKPSNILILPNGGVMLIDFGSARDYAETTQTVMYSPGYAPLEQLSERAVRGAGTDFFALASTLYHALAGVAPASAPDRAAGVALTPIREIRRDVEPAFAASIESAMSLRIGDRPQSVAEWRRHLSEEPGPEPIVDLQELDRQLVAARELRFDRRGCPACNGVLIEPRPLRKQACPVCRDGSVRLRDLDEDLCPNCHQGRVRTHANADPMVVCPTCAQGLLASKRKGFLSRDVTLACTSCAAQYRRVEEGWERSDGVVRTSEEWRAQSRRAAEVRICDYCDAQFDRRPDGRWQQMVPKAEHPPMYLDEWGRVAVGLSPSVGNAYCDLCDADFWLDPNRLTLLDAGRDPFRFAEEFLGRSLSLEDVRWLGVGKSSGHHGPVCDQCGTEFDRDGDRLRLIRSGHRILAHNTGEDHTLGDWHRLSRSLPVQAEEAAYLARIDDLLREAYRGGELPFETGNGGLHWRGRARRESDGQESTLSITDEEIRFGGAFRKWRISQEELVTFSGTGTELELNGELFEIEQVELSTDLRSGVRTLLIDAADIAERLRRTTVTDWETTDDEGAPPVV